ncbi:MAG TPA: TatD family hydrolase, partial [Chondromyces sp.]|nr:TatD family hydrolase [Chondromyces sp.]
MFKVIDAHIHLDKYSQKEQKELLASLHTVEGLISVSMDLASCKKNMELSNGYRFIHPAFGWHPEQKLLEDHELADLIEWIMKHRKEMCAIGEVGLPYYLKKQHSEAKKQEEGYVEVLEQFIRLAKNLSKPIVLHAIYEDAPLVCELLEKHTIQHAHFQWFKGDKKTIERMMKNDWYISVTPDVLYEEEIQELARLYPVEQMMVETDGPWPFEGPFSGKMTHPIMIHQSIQEIA